MQHDTSYSLYKILLYVGYHSIPKIKYHSLFLFLPGSAAQVLLGFQLICAKPLSSAISAWKHLRLDMT